MSIRIRGVLTLVATLVAAACSETPTEMPDLSVVSVELRPADRTLTVGDTMLVVVFPRTADGQLLGGEPVTWTSGSPSVASLTPKGIYAILRAVTPGTAEVMAVVGGKIGAIGVTVIATPLIVSSVQITPSISALQVGKQFELLPLVRTADGTVIGGRKVTWQTSDPTIMTVGGAVDGSYVTLTAHRAGTVVITATAGGKSDARTFQVTAG